MQQDRKPYISISPILTPPDALFDNRIFVPPHLFKGFIHLFIHTMQRKAFNFIKKYYQYGALGRYIPIEL